MKLQQHVTSTNILDASQSESRLGHSTQMALKDYLLMAIITGKISMLTLLNLSAAFDTVDYKVLLTYLHNIERVNNPALD